MKPYGILCLIIAIIMLLSPLAAIDLGAPEEESASERESEVQTDSDESEAAAVKTDEDTISVFMTSSEKTETLAMRDYIIGAVGAEMPASYETEALKAQALAAVTFAEYSKQNGGDENLGGADISSDSSRHQGYMTTDEMKEKWGDAFESYYEKIASAVDAVLDEIITYDGEPIMAAYHAISTGQTESAKNMWGKDIPYLVSVESEGDPYSSRYRSEENFTAKELKDALKYTDGVSFDDDEENWITVNKTTDAGTVTDVTVCGRHMTGMEVRNLLGLRSPSFTVDYEDGSFRFTVHGYGHGVGMSQYGADYYARQGMTYREIIEHYYPGTEIEKRT